jgi:hypothetical protein
MRVALVVAMAVHYSVADVFPSLLLGSHNAYNFVGVVAVVEQAPKKLQLEAQVSSLVEVVAEAFVVQVRRMEILALPVVR